jgi:hypothetical protein
LEAIKVNGLALSVSLALHVIENTRCSLETSDGTDSSDFLLLHGVNPIAAPSFLTLYASASLSILVGGVF